MKEETNCIHGGYDSKKAFKSVKCPIFQTSTFQFENCKEGAEFFKKAAGVIPKKEGEDEGYIYSRVGNPSLTVFEKRLAKIDGNEDGASFNSGMSAINTTLMTFLKSGDGIIATSPLYGGTMTLMSKIFPTLGIKVKFFDSNSEKLVEEIKNYLQDEKNSVNNNNCKVIMTETPTNPLNSIVDIEGIVEIRNLINEKKKKNLNKNSLELDERCVVVVDNTFLGPILQKPSKLNVDVVLYSATKFIGGHSDVVAGAITGKTDVVKKIKGMRMAFGSQGSPFDCFLLCRSLETLKIRMKKQQKNAIKVFKFLEEYQSKHPDILKELLYPLALKKDSKQLEIYQKQCLGPGSIISILLKNKEESLAFIDNLKLVVIAVSLGSTESLIQHPYSMTHACVDEKLKLEYGITENLVRLSVGLENVDDLILDLKSSLSNLEKK